ncbi:hypothetical protein VTK56DRAFT_9512 [Thermocarpiscus australiensis]
MALQISTNTAGEWRFDLDLDAYKRPRHLGKTTGIHQACFNELTERLRLRLRMAHWDLVEYLWSLDNLENELFPVFRRSCRFAAAFAVAKTFQFCLWPSAKYGSVLTWLTAYNTGFASIYALCLYLVSRCRRQTEELKAKVSNRSVFAAAPFPPPRPPGGQRCGEHKLPPPNPRGDMSSSTAHRFPAALYRAAAILVHIGPAPSLPLVRSLFPFFK